MAHTENFIPVNLMVEYGMGQIIKARYTLLKQNIYDSKGSIDEWYKNLPLPVVVVGVVQLLPILARMHELVVIYPIPKRSSR